MLKKYKIGFDVWALGLFLLIMLPNFLWFAVPAPHDILRGESVTDKLDSVASVCQVVMLAALCVVQKRDAPKRGLTPLLLLAGVCVLLYFASWGGYYGGFTNAVIIMGLTLPPCLAFLFYAIDRKNGAALVPACVFTVCHVVYAFLNFLL